jgi:ribosomal protein S27AE
MTIKVGARLICNNCGEEEFIPHADTGNVEVRKIVKGDWVKKEIQEGGFLKKKHYCPDCGDKI